MEINCEIVLKRNNSFNENRQIFFILLHRLWSFGINSHLPCVDFQVSFGKCKFPMRKVEKPVPKLQTLVQPQRNVSSNLLI